MIRVDRRVNRVRRRLKKAKRSNPKPAISTATAANANLNSPNSKRTRVSKRRARTANSFRASVVAHATVRARATPAPWTASRAKTLKRKANAVHSAANAKAQQTSASPPPRARAANVVNANPAWPRASRANASTARAKPATSRASTSIQWAYRLLIWRKIMGRRRRWRKPKKAYWKANKTNPTTISKSNLSYRVASKASMSILWVNRMRSIAYMLITKTSKHLPWNVNTISNSAWAYKRISWIIRWIIPSRATTYQPTASTVLRRASTSTARNSRHCKHSRTIAESAATLTATRVRWDILVVSASATEKSPIRKINAENAGSSAAKRASAANVKAIPRAKTASSLARAVRASRRWKKSKSNGVTTRRERRPRRRSCSILCHLPSLVVIRTSKQVKTPSMTTAKRWVTLRKRINHHKLLSSKRIMKEKMPCQHCRRTLQLIKTSKKSRSRKVWVDCINSLPEIAHREEGHSQKTTIWSTPTIPVKDSRPFTERQVLRDPQEEGQARAHPVPSYPSIHTEPLTFRLSSSQQLLKRKNTWRVNPTKWNTTNFGHQILNSISMKLVSSKSSSSSTTRTRPSLWKRWCFISSRCPTLILLRSWWLMKMMISMRQEPVQKVSRVRSNSSSCSWW